MFNNLPKKWSRRLFAIYVTVTIFGGIVFSLFLLLIGLLYWMNAQVDLPAAAQVAHPAARVKLIVRCNSMKELPEPVAESLTRGLPDQIRRLFDRSSRAPILIGWSLPPDTDAPLLVAALGRGPGQFYLIRRDMEKRARKGTIPFASQEFRDVVVFAPAPAGTEGSAFALVRCALIKSNDVKQVQEAAELITETAKASPAPAQAPPGTGFTLEALTLADLVKFLPDERLRQFEERCPQLAQKSVEVWGDFPSSRVASVHLVFSSDSPQELADDIQAAVKDLNIETVLVETMADRVQLHFTLRLDGNHVQTSAGD